MDLRKLITKKAELQHEINTAKETYQKLLQSMQELKAQEKTQQEKVQTLQKTLHERVANGGNTAGSWTCKRLWHRPGSSSQRNRKKLQSPGKKTCKGGFQLWFGPQSRGAAARSTPRCKDAKQIPQKDRGIGARPAGAIGTPEG